MAGLIYFIAFLAFISTVRSFDGRDDNCQVTDVTVVMDGDVMYVTWQAPDSTLCPEAKEYRINYYVNGGEGIGPLPPLAGSTIVMIHFGELFCEQVAFKIITYSDDAHTPLAILDYSYDRNIPTPQVTDVVEQDGKLRVTWDFIWDNTKTDCEVSYSVKYDDQHHDTSNNYYDIDANNINICSTKTIEIVASSNGYNSLPNNYIYKRNLPSLKIIETINTPSIIFEPLSETPSDCGTISYKIIENDLKCLKISYTLKATTDTEYESDENKLEIQKTPGPVHNLIVETSEKEINLNWESPTHLQNCNVEYEINAGDSTISTHVTYVNIPIALPSCDEELVHVKAIIESTKGESSTIRAFGKIKKVENLKCIVSDNNVECSWSEPNNSEKCKSISYRLNYYNGKEVVTSNLDVTLEGIGCQSSWVTVETFKEIDGEIIRGETTETNVEGCTLLLDFLRLK